MDLSPDSFEGENLTEKNGIEEWRIIELFEEIGDQNDSVPDWEHWRTSPNYTCIRGGQWMIQVGRNDPILSIDAQLEDRVVSAIVMIETPAKLMEEVTQVAEHPKHTFLELIESRDQNDILVYQRDIEDHSPLKGYEARQEAWGEQVTQPNNEGDQ